MSRTVRALAAAAAALALVSACNSTSNHTDPGKPGGAAAGNTRGVSADSVRPDGPSISSTD